MNHHALSRHDLIGRGGGTCQTTYIINVHTLHDQVFDCFCRELCTGVRSGAGMRVNGVITSFYGIRAQNHFTHTGRRITRHA